MAKVYPNNWNHTDYIDNDSTILEKEPMERVAKQTILNSKIQEIELTENKKIKFKYDQTSIVMNILNKY